MASITATYSLIQQVSDQRTTSDKQVYPLKNISLSNGKLVFIFNNSVLKSPEMDKLILNICKNNKNIIVICKESLKEDPLSQIKALSRKCISIIRQNHVDLAYQEVKQHLLSFGKKFSIIAFENSSSGIQAAAQIDALVIGVMTNEVKEQWPNADIQCFSHTILDDLKITHIHQFDYLRALKEIKNSLKNKMGYPTSLMRSLHGKFTETGLSLDPSSPKLIGNGCFSIEGGFDELYMNNVGDPYHPADNWKNTHEFEREILAMMGGYYGLEKETEHGFMTTGGTEGNFAGLWYARDNLMNKTSAKSIILYCSELTHYSVKKVARQLLLDARVITCKESGEMDVAAFRRAINSHMEITPHIPFIVHVNLGTTTTGAIDNVLEIKKVLEEHARKPNMHFIVHADAALNGAALPVLKPFGDGVKNYFKDLGISSIAISGHKFFGTEICGIFLTTQKYKQASLGEVEDAYYIAGLHDSTPSGSRSGHNPLELHNVLKILNFDSDRVNLKKVIAQCLRNGKYLYEKLGEFIGKQNILWLPRSFNLIIPRPTQDMVNEYCLMPLNEHEAGICILANLTEKLINRFVNDYKNKFFSQKKEIDYQRWYHDPALAENNYKINLSLLESIESELI